MHFGKDEIVHTIKKTVLVAGVFLSGLLIGCTETKSDAVEFSSFNMDYLDSDLVNWVGEFYLYEDSETHVEYLVYKYNQDGIAITPRYKADGSLFIKGD